MLRQCLGGMYMCNRAPGRCSGNADILMRSEKEVPRSHIQGIRKAGQTTGE